MRIWIDLANSPHVPVFAPVVRELEERGHQVVLTARDFAQTLDLARLAGLDVVPVGRHGGRSSLGKAQAIAGRAWKLRDAVQGPRPDLAVSHNSYAHGVAARSMGIPYFTLMDYEHTPANHVSFRMAMRVFLPSAIPVSTVRKYGATSSKVVHFDGYKEQIYLDELASRLSDGRDALPFRVADDRTIVVARPPADFAIYHRFENPLFDEWLYVVGRDPSVLVVLLPRTPEQRQRAAEMNLPSVRVPGSAIPGPQLMAGADLVVSAGGSMNREAAVLGIPAYSLFAGDIGAVDRELADRGRMELIETKSDLDRIELKRRAEPVPLRNDGLIRLLVDDVLSIRGASEARSSRDAA